MDDNKLRSTLISKADVQLIIEALKAQNKTLNDRDKITRNEALQDEFTEELKKY